MAYGLTDNPSNGPFPNKLYYVSSTNVTVEYKSGQEFTYDNSEISGFSVCCVQFKLCDSREAWTVLDRASTMKATRYTIQVNVQGICDQGNPTGLAYLWEDTPTKRMIGLPIYSNDSFHLPGAPWKLELVKLEESNEI